MRRRDNSFPVEVDGKLIGRVSRADDGTWVPRDLGRKRQGAYRTPAEARAGLIEAAAAWEARDIAAGRPVKAYGQGGRDE